MNCAAAHWLVYMIETDCGRLYTGITTDMQRRWRQHSGELSGGAKFFRGRKPRQLVLLEPHPNRAQASRREAEIKSLSRAQKRALIEAASTADIETLKPFCD